MNRRLTLRRPPEGQVVAGDFRLETVSVPPLEPDTFLARTKWISVDPMIRIFIDARPLGGAMPGLPPGSVIPGAAVAEVIDSRHSGFAAGDIVEGRLGWQDYSVSTGAGVRKVDPALAPIETALGVMGLPGFSAYAGLHVAGGVKPGETVLVSGAGGAVGSVIAALVNVRGGRAIGIARGADKCRHLVEHLGYAAMADRARGDVVEQLMPMLPDGADIYFDNIGGPFFADAVDLMKRHGRVIICGLMAQYQFEVRDDAVPGRLQRVLTTTMARGLRIEAFSNTDYGALRPAFEREMVDHLSSGAVTSDCHVVEGLENTPDAFVRLFDESVIGKVLVRV